MRHHHHHARHFQQYENPAEAQARHRIYHLRRFYHAAIMYMIIIPFLFTINYLTFHGYWWAWWPALGMSIAILLKGLHAVGRNFIWDEAWEDRKVAEILAKKGKQ